MLRCARNDGRLVRDRSRFEAIDLKGVIPDARSSERSGIQGQRPCILVIAPGFPVRPSASRE
ncbi:MAG: hypothetical protein C3F11_15735 [Methylocystaceae bacterium]|nr:MAG: hypothetical protein C3F11_15735 [Methylocystaceae bacterium]